QFNGTQNIYGTSTTGPQALDQQQLVSDGMASGVDHWQAFTPAASGLLTAVAIQLASPVGGTNSPGTIRIYSGVGTNGPLLIGQSVTWNQAFSIQTNVFFSTITLNAGSQYTLYFGSPAATNVWVGFAQNDRYPAGTTDFLGHDY